MKLPHHRLIIEAGASKLAIERRPFFDTGLSVTMAAAFAWVAVAFVLLGIGGWWAQAFAAAAAAMVSPAFLSAARRHRASWIALGWRAFDIVLHIVVPVLLKALDLFIFVCVLMLVFNICKALGIL